jgi:hypothetical protein
MSAATFVKLVADAFCRYPDTFINWEGGWQYGGAMYVAKRSATYLHYLFRGAVRPTVFLLQLFISLTTPKVPIGNLCLIITLIFI